MVGQDREETTVAAGEVGANQADDAVTQREPRSHCGIHDDVPRIDLPRKEDRRAVARERHGLFRCGTFAAARVRRPSIQNIRERYSDHVPPGPNTWRLNILPLGQFRPAPRLSVSPIHIAQQCGPLTTYRRASCLSASTICRYITAIGRTIGEVRTEPGPHCRANFMVHCRCFTDSGASYHEHRQLE